MPDSAVSQSEPTDLPVVLPPEEIAASGDFPATGILAAQEDDFINRSLSAHTVEAAKLRNRLALAYIKNMKADRAMRKTYAGRILKYLEFYSIGVMVLLLLAGFKPGQFTLEPGVMVALVGSTAIAAIGLVGFIARGLFRTPPAPQLPDKQDQHD